MPGCRDIVRDGINGLLVPPHDVGGLASALERVIVDAELRGRFAQAGRGLVEQHFALEGVLERVWQTYRALSVVPLPA